MLRIFEVTKNAIGTASKMLELQLRGMGAEGDYSSAETADDAPFLGQIGIAVKPVIRRTLRAIAVPYGVQLWVIALFDKSKRPTDLQDGEIRLHGLEQIAAAIRILSTGKIQIDSVSGQDVQLNGGTLKVARVTDGVYGGTLAGSNGGGPVTFVFQPLDANGSPMGPPITSALVTISGVIANSGGSDRVKA